jgi:hypothetical protein
MMKTNEAEERTDEEAGNIPEVALAKGVLVQAKQDLRRFAAAQDSIGREMYADAYSWVTANDFSWPYSFQNICKALRLSPESVRAELLPGFQDGWLFRSRRMAEIISSSFRGSLANVFSGHRNSLDDRHSRRAVLVH